MLQYFQVTSSKVSSMSSEEWSAQDDPADDDLRKLIQNFNTNILKRYEEFVQMDTRISLENWVVRRNPVMKIF